MKLLPLKVITLSFIILLITACTSNVNLDENQKIDQTTGQPQAKTEEKTERIMLTPSNLSDYNSPQNPQCDEVFNSDVPNQTVEYRNLEKGLSVQIPYNPNWGNDRFRLNPYDEYENRLVFGPIGGFEACTWVRSYSLNFLPAKSAQEVLAGLDSQLLLTKPGEVTIGNLTAVKYANGGLCTYPAYQVIGQLHNYELVPTCGTDLEKEFTFMENIIRSMELIGEAENNEEDSKLITITPAEGNEDLLNKIREELNGDDYIELTKKPIFPLPSDIHEAQIDKYYLLGEVFIALVRKPSINVWLKDLPQDYNANFAGIIAADSDKDKWEKILTIEDESFTDKNNPYAIWVERDYLTLSIVDQTGAGSGEGVMKLLTTNDLVSWNQVGCYYFGSNYRGPNEDGDYFQFSATALTPGGPGLEQFSGEGCNNFSLK